MTITQAKIRKLRQAIIAQQKPVLALVVCLEIQISTQKPKLVFRNPSWHLETRIRTCEDS